MPTGEDFCGNEKAASDPEYMETINSDMAAFEGTV